MEKSRNPRLWCLYHDKTGRLLRGLFFDEVRAAIQAVDESELNEWKVWCEGEKSWSPVFAHPALLEPFNRSLNMPIPPMEDDSDNHTEDNVVELSLPGQHTLGDMTLEPLLEFDEGAQISGHTIRPREFVRYGSTVYVEIADNVRKFKSQSVDISVGGVHLRDPLPPWVKGYFRLRLTKPGQSQGIEVQGCLVENQPPHARYRIQILPLKKPSDEKLFEEWLAA